MLHTYYCSSFCAEYNETLLNDIFLNNNKKNPTQMPGHVPGQNFSRAQNSLRLPFSSAVTKQRMSNWGKDAIFTAYEVHGLHLELRLHS